MHPVLVVGVLAFSLYVNNINWFYGRSYQNKNNNWIRLTNLNKFKLYSSTKPYQGITKFDSK